MATTFRCLYCTFRNIAGRRTNQRTLPLFQATTSILACCSAKSQRMRIYLLSECSRPCCDSTKFSKRTCARGSTSGGMVRVRCCRVSYRCYSCIYVQPNTGNAIREQPAGELDVRIYPQRPDYSAEFAAYITLGATYERTRQGQMSNAWLAR